MRRSMGMGRRGPGLFGMAARTAVVAGTATAVSKSVSGSMDTRAAQQQQTLAAQAANAQAAKPGAGADETIAQLQKLTDLQKQGFLTDEEFAQQKARILGS